MKSSPVIPLMLAAAQELWRPSHAQPRRYDPDEPTPPGPGTGDIERLRRAEAKRQRKKTRKTRAIKISNCFVSLEALEKIEFI